jgi:hypothetical protein
VGDCSTCEPPTQDRRLAHVSTQSYSIYIGHTRCLPLQQCMHGGYVPQAHLFQSLYHTLDYGRALASAQSQLLGDLLAKVHNDIITFWNFIDQQNVRYFCGIIAYTLIRSPVRSSAVKRLRTSYSSLSRTLKNHEISVYPGPPPCHQGMCRYNGVEWNVTTIS